MKGKDEKERHIKKERQTKGMSVTALYTAHIPHGSCMQRQKVKKRKKKEREKERTKRKK